MLQERRTLTFCLIALLIALTGTMVEAQRDQLGVAFRNIGRQEGLPRSTVFAIAQDSQGILWLGTRTGVSKYDGHRVTEFTARADGHPPVEDVRVLYVDPTTQDIWMGGGAHLYRYHKLTGQLDFFAHDEVNPSNTNTGRIRCIYRDQNGRLLVGSTGGLSVYSERTESFVGVPLAGGEPLIVTFLVGNGEGELYVGTNNGVFKQTSSAPTSFQRLPGTAQIHFTAGALGKAGTLWLGTRGQGLLAYQRTSQELTQYGHKSGAPGSLSNHAVRSLALSADGGLWVGTTKGLNYLPPGGKSFQVFTSADGDEGGLPDDFILSLLTDRAGSLWVGTYYGGVQHFNERFGLFKNYHHDPYRNSISGNIVSAFAETENGDLYVGTEGAGLNLLRRATGQFEHFPATQGGLSGNNIKDLLLTGPKLWIGTWQAGLNCFDTLQQRFQYFRHDPANPNSLAHDNAYALHQQGDLLYVATYGGGLDVLNVTTNQFTHYTQDPSNGNSISSNLTRTLMRDQQGVLWVGTDAGINRVELDGEGYPKQFENHFPTETIFSSQMGGGGTIWIGTSNSGLFHFNPATNQTEVYTTEEGLSGNTVFGILTAEDGTLWVSTENGLSALDLVSKTFTHYNHANGLRNIEYNFHAYHKMRSGELLFGGLQGVTRFDPGRMQAINTPPPLVFTDLVIDNEPVVVGEPDGALAADLNTVDQLSFEYGEATFTLRFAALNYVNPENNRYAYMLEGLDKDWRYLTGVGEVSYTIQREGDYTFLLKLDSPSGANGGVIKRLPIKVQPPFYRTWWAYLLYTCLGVAAAVFLTHFVRLRHRLRLEEVARAQQEAVTEMKLRFFTNITHEFRTPLTLILGPLEQLLRRSTDDQVATRQLGMIKRNTDRLLKLVNQTLTFRRLETAHEPLRVNEVDADSFLQNIHGSFTDMAARRQIDYRYVNQAPGLRLWLDVDKFEKVLFNLLSNAFKFTPDGGAIHVALSATDQSASITVSDSGPGISFQLRDEIFKRFYEKSSGVTSTIKSSGIGLAISQEMMRLHGGSVRLEDPVASGAKELRGAKFIVELPLGRAHFSDQDVQVIEPGHASEAPEQAVEVATPPAALDPNCEDKEDNVAHRLLVVDDNDDMLRFLSDTLADVYTVTTATNGKQALALARAEPPDAIIADVMMPEMDGLEFSRAVKGDLSISHVPVILLTAQTSETYRIEGLRTGADDYLTKPFNATELRLRVRNLIAARRQSQRRFAKTLSLEPKEITITDTDEAFLSDAMKIVEEEIGNIEFNVEDFASKMTVSRSLMYTKLKALTGQTPNNFIKTVRLKRAAFLLKSGQMNVSEVTYAVGFKNPKYFRQCFKAQFDIVPSKYRHSLVENDTPPISAP